MNTTIQSKHINRYLIALLALLVIPLSGLSIDIYVPSLPAVATYFHTTKSLAQFSITAYMIGIGIMQLFAGGISDSFGRRKPFLISMAIFIAATSCIPFANNIYVLLLMRFIQGISVAMVVVPIRSIIPDLFTGKDLFKMMTYMTMAWSIGPIVAPAIGGYLQMFFGWKANFYFLLCYSVFAWLLIFKWVPETSKHRHEFHIPSLFNRYKQMILDPDYISSLSINGLLYSFIILFSVVSPFLIQNVMHYTPAQFGHIALIIGIAWFLGSLTNRFTIEMSPDLKSTLFFSIMLVIAMLMTILAIIAKPTLTAIVIPMFLLAWLGGTIFPNNFAQAVALFPNFSGSSNALFGAMVFCISGAASALGAILIANTALPLAISYVVIIASCLSLFLIRKHTKNQHYVTSNAIAQP